MIGFLPLVFSTVLSRAMMTMSLAFFAACSFCFFQKPHVTQDAAGQKRLRLRLLFAFLVLLAIRSSLRRLILKRQVSLHSKLPEVKLVSSLP